MRIITRIIIPRLLSGLLMVVLVSILFFVMLQQLPIDPVGVQAENPSRPPPRVTRYNSRAAAA